MMEAGMKEYIKKRHRYMKTKELFISDDGLAERQSAFLVVARPLLVALTEIIREVRMRIKVHTLMP